MWPFWELAIAPIFDAAGARRVVEIGALRGDTTVLMLDRLGPDAELHVIDPKPEFDPSEHERAFPGRYIFHRDLSLNALPTLPPVDVALVDGDHNWYTVVNELQMLADTSRQAGQPMPVMICHDVCWPYGRRDLYYDPDTIPEEHRQPFARLGMRMGTENLVWMGGLNPTMNNAVHEGGERNGVMTGIDDFVAGWDRPIRRVLLPIYWGLEILVEHDRLEATPELGRYLDWLEGAEGRGQLLELAESTRLRAMLTQHNVFFAREKQHAVHADRYLDLLKGALLDEHYIENEVRISQLMICLERGAVPDEQQIRDPGRRLPKQVRHLLARRRAGHRVVGEEQASDAFPYTTMGRARLDALQSALETIRSEAVDGDLVECGTGRGGGAVFLRAFLETHNLKDPTVWVIDRFTAEPPDDVDAGSGLGGGPGLPTLLPDLNLVRDAFERFDLFDDRVRFLQGPFADTLREEEVEKIALLRLGPGSQTATSEILEHLYPKVPVGGFVVIDAYADPAVCAAVDAFRARHGIGDLLERVDWSGAHWRKTEQIVAEASDAPVSPARAPLARPAPPLGGGKDLTVVVVFYNMRREARRTLHSLSRSYQEGIDDLDYEVIAVENGSSAEQRLGDEFVRSFGPEFRYLDMGADAPPSPVFGLNAGVAAGVGRHFALMIDGAHVLTPGVLHYGMLGLSTYAPAVVSTQQWYLGPGQQPEATSFGYDQEFEDRLLDQIEWPSDGYRLFDVGHFIGERDWLDGMWESNCLFVPRSLLAQTGGFDENFQVAGGGYANLELYERLGASPDVRFATMLGEGSFHQVHGGTTTNTDTVDERSRRIGSYARQFFDMRGRGFVGHNKRIHFVGTMFPEARRTRARHRTAPSLFKAGAPGDPDGFPEKATPMSESLQREYTDAFWHTLQWRNVTWMGRKVARPPNDLLIYHELIHRLRPDWIVETTRGASGRTDFLASMCDLIGHGRVISVAREPALPIEQRAQANRSVHPRVTHIVGHPHEADTIAEVHDVVGDDPNALVFLGSRSHRRLTVAEFEGYKDLVPVGSYVVVEETIVNGHPVWAAFGPGPGEALQRIAEDTDFVADTAMERLGLTFNPGGFRRRVR